KGVAQSFAVSTSQYSSASMIVITRLVTDGSPEKPKGPGGALDLTTQPERHRRHLPRKRVPTARLPERGLRESEDLRTPLCGHGTMWRRSGWPPIQGSPRNTVLQCAPSKPLLSPARGKG